MTRLFAFCLLLLFGCGPEKAKEEVKALPKRKANAALEQVADSVSNARQDGTDTSTGLPLDIKQQLPAELEVYLDRAHGLWQFPSLSNQDLARIPKEEQGPYFLQADLNQDRLLDYAIQIVEDDTIYIYAFLKNKTDEDFTVHLLEKHPLLARDGKKRSNRYVQLAKKSERYYDKVLQKEITMPQDAVAVGNEDTLVVYLWAQGKFKKAATGTGPKTEGR
ncbi:hypothetical protein [Rufibacter soli]